MLSVLQFFVSLAASWLLAMILSFGIMLAFEWAFSGESWKEDATFFTMWLVIWILMLVVVLT